MDTLPLRHPYRSLRVLGALEGLSFVLLLFVCVPLKYAMGNPMGVKVVGPIHGALFVLYCGALYRALDHGLSGRKIGLGFLASILPFGFVFFDRVLAGEERAESDG